MVGEDSPQDRRPPTEVPLALLSLGPGFYCCDFAEFGERGESGSVVNAECAMRNQCR